MKANQPAAKPLSMDPTMPQPEPAQPMPQAQQWQVARRPERSTMDTVRNVFLILALALLAISVAVAYVSANSIVSIWFEDQWVPVARLVLALLVAAAAGWAIMRLTRRKA
jgi:hypothetical protein